MSVYILEGVDKQGKTTLARKLCETFVAEYVKFSQPKMPPFQEYSGFIRSIDPLKHYVIDRFFVGELVYGPIYRGSSGVSLDQLVDLQKQLLEKQAESVLIYCETDIDRTFDNFVKDNETFTKMSDVHNLRKAYKETLKHIYLPVYRFDYAMDQDHAKVLNYLLRREVKNERA